VSLDITGERVPVLMYHRVGEPADETDRKYCVQPRRFVAQLKALANAGHTAISLDTFFGYLDDGTAIPERSFVLTFDDGFRDLEHYAMPVLNELGWPCTVFLVTGLLGRSDAWNADLGGNGHALLDRGSVVQMARYGVRFESHTRTHRRLLQLSASELLDELAGSKADLEALLGRPVRYLAYPFGETDERVIAAAKNAGYVAAFSAQPGFNRRDIDRYRIRRVDVFGCDTPAQLLRKLRFGANDGSWQALFRYYGRRTARRLWQ